MAYGKIKADAIVYDNSGSDVEVSTADITNKAGLASPTFTGTPAAPTAGSGTNTTQIATTAFVTAAIPAPIDISGKSNIASPTFTGVPAAPTAAQGTNTTQLATTAYVQAEVGQTIQAYDADTAKRDTSNTFTGTNTFNGALGITNVDVIGRYSQAAEAVSALDIDLSQSNYFTKTINGNSTFTFSNPANSGVASTFTLELTHTSGTVTWPSSVKFPADTAPTLTTGKTHLFMFVTDDGGTRYRGAALADYVN